jgi:hypothetical protein
MTSPNLPQPQPVVKAAVVAFAASILSLLVAFNINVTDDQQVAILGALNAGGALLGLYLAWRASKKVTPVDSPKAVIEGELVDLVPLR